ncbi:MAG: hypothetical protein NTZ69_16245 [Bacteroidia bacterium]|nr:hypothetical protein [Bacteroidia bacterium]
MNWKVIKTNGTGNTTDSTGIDDVLKKLYFINEKVGFFGGDNSDLVFLKIMDWRKTERIKEAILFKTSDGGSVWKKQIPFDKGEVLCMQYIDSTLFALTQSYYGENSDSVRSHIYTSIDNGDNWILSSTTDFNLREIKFWTKNNGIATSDESQYYNSKEAIYETKDGGKTWIELKNLPAKVSGSYELSKNGIVYYLPQLTGNYIGFNLITGETTTYQIPSNINPFSLYLDNRDNLYLITEDENEGMLIYLKGKENYLAIKFPTKGLSVIKANIFESSISVFAEEQDKFSQKIRFFRSEDLGKFWNEENLPISYKASPIAFFGKDKVWAWSLEGQLQVRE